MRRTSATKLANNGADLLTFEDQSTIPYFFFRNDTLSLFAVEKLPAPQPFNNATHGPPP